MAGIGDGAEILGPGEGRLIDVGEFAVTVFADSETTSGAFSLIETSETKVGGGPPLHIHRDCSESFYVLAGAYQMILDDRAYECRQGSFIYIPRGMRHTFTTLAAGSRKLNLYTPSAMVGYFDELAEGLAAGIEEADLDAIAGRYAMDVVGPVPDNYLSDPTARS